MARNVEEPVRSAGDAHNDYHEDHPAFGVAIVTRSSGSPRTLFQSDLQHNESIRLSICHAQRSRNLIRDWVFPRREVVEVEMSLAQWGSLVSSIGIGSGVPVTIRSIDQKQVPGLPYQPRIAEAVAETKDTVRRLMEGARRTFDALKVGFEGKVGIKEMRRLMDSHESSLTNTESNAGFAIKQVTEATEQVVSQGKSDIEAHILAAAQLTGLTAPVQVPELMITDESPLTPREERALNFGVNGGRPIEDEVLDDAADEQDDPSWKLS